MGSLGISSFAAPQQRALLEQQVQAQKQQVQQAQAERKSRFQARVSHVIAHERAHQAAAGGLAGAMVINADEASGMVSGHVPIRMEFGKTAADALRFASIIAGAASAPGGDMSAQDQAVAAQARTTGNALYSQRKSLEDNMAQLRFGEASPHNWVIPSGQNPFKTN